MFAIKLWRPFGFTCTIVLMFHLVYLQVIDWVLGPGERYLSTSKDIGDSVISCEILRKEHEEFELNARVRNFHTCVSIYMDMYALLLMYF